MADHLFSPLTLRGVTIPNRVGLSPMCQYTARDGMVGDWHRVHYGARAVGGVGLVMTEAAAVVPRGRISPADVGLWHRGQVDGWREITDFILRQGAVPAVQLAHAGRKAGTRAPWEGGGPVPESEGGWIPVAPSAIAFAEGYPEPRELTEPDLDALEEAFVTAARMALEAGFQVVELHMAHGYLLHSFLSPVSNRRSDDYGGSRENRMRFPLRIAEAVRGAWPEQLPLMVRISATDWLEEGWTVEDSIAFCRELEKLNVDMVDVSSGGISLAARERHDISAQPEIAERIRAEVGLSVAAVGGITDPEQANALVAGGAADMVMMGRELLRSPQWPLHAARQLGVEVRWPRQYERAR